MHAVALVRLRAASLLAAVLALAVAGGGGALRAAPSPEPVAYTLSPELRDGSLQALRVEVRFRADASGQTVFAWPESWAGDDRLWRWARDVAVDGAVSVASDGKGRWRIVSRPGAALRVRYRVVSAFDHDPTVDDDARQSLPIIRPHWFYTVGETLFGAPEGRDDAPAAFAWTGAPPGWTYASDLQHLSGPGRRGVRPGKVADIQESISLGGTDVRVAGSLDGRSRVRVASRGAYRFPADAFASLVLRIIAAERRFWGDGPEAPFLVTMAPLAAVPGSHVGSGTGRTDAFARWQDTGAGLEDAPWLLAHEYFHTWNARQLGGYRDGPAAEPLGYWFGEGFTDYYARRMALSAGVMSLADFARSWNALLRDYDLSPVRDAPNAEIPGAFWSDPERKQLPYRRGAVLAAELDGRLRAADPAGRGLDDLMRATRRRAAAGTKRPQSDASTTFREVLAASHPDLDARVEAVIERGAPVMLDADAFAPCFRISTADASGFDRGFDIGATMKNGSHVTGLRSGGPADRAGLKEGDRISIDESGIPDPSVPRRYVVHEAGGGTHEVRYLPASSPRPLQRLSVAPGLDAAATRDCERRFGGRGT